jgi:TRAP-type C4-dicarboxylate transport system permease large subunit
MSRFRTTFTVGACVFLSGCYHQVFSTGLAPATTGVTKSWHPTYLFGLVQAAPIDVRSTCPSGIALVSTRMTFPNGLVGGLTLGIFTPHEVKVVCASGSAVLPAMERRTLGAAASSADARRVFSEAIALATATGNRVAIVTDDSMNPVHTVETGQ